MTTEPKRRRRRKRKREDKPYANQRALWDTRWTPNNEEFRALIEAAINDAGSVLALSRAIDMKYRHLRRIYHGHSKAVSYRIADQILARSSVAHKMLDLPWLTVDQLVEQGIWAPQKTFMAKYNR